MLHPVPPEITFGPVFKQNFLRRVGLLLLSDGADVLQGCSAEQEASVSRLLLVLLSAGLPFTSTACQTDTKSGTNWHGLWQLSDVPVKLLMTRLTPSSIQTVSRYGNTVKIRSSCACCVLQYWCCLLLCRPFPCSFSRINSHVPMLTQCPLLHRWGLSGMRWRTALMIYSFIFCSDCELWMY